MTFIKVGNTVINTSHIAVVELNRVLEDGINCVVIVMAATEGTFQKDQGDWKLKEYWFRGEEAQKLRAYFSDPHYAIDLLQSPPRREVFDDIWESPSPPIRPRIPRRHRRESQWGETLEQYRPASGFGDYTETAIKVIMLAQEEARRLGHSYVGTEQILLGLLGEGLGVAAQVLKSLGVNLTDARIQVEKIIGFGSGVTSNSNMRFIPRSIRFFIAKIAGLEPRMGAEMNFTPRCKQVLEFTVQEAAQLGSNIIDTEHLLLGLIRQDEGVAVRVLENLGVELLQVRTEVLRRLS